jgi:hypothetical protein
VILAIDVGLDQHQETRRATQQLHTQPVFARFDLVGDQAGRHIARRRAAQLKLPASAVATKAFMSASRSIESRTCGVNWSHSWNDYPEHWKELLLVQEPVQIEANITRRRGT